MTIIETANITIIETANITINETNLHNGTYFAPINQLISHHAFTNHGFHFQDKIARISKSLIKY
tara:strand:- start:84 stop:275 length:192 start_codon:yes stop_codon:yes gene_type:complete